MTNASRTEIREAFEEPLDFVDSAVAEPALSVSGSLRRDSHDSG